MWNDPPFATAYFADCFFPLLSTFIHLCFLYFACALIKQKTRPKYQRYTDGYRCCSRCQTKKKECKEEKKNEANNECTLRCTYFVKHETSYFSDHTFSQVVNGVDDNCEKGKINNDNILKHLRHRFSCFSTNSIVSSNFVFSEVDHVWVAQLDRSQLSCAWILCKQQTRKNFPFFIRMRISAANCLFSVWPPKTRIELCASQRLLFTVAVLQFGYLFYFRRCLIQFVNK